MKNSKYRDYWAIGLVAFLVIAASLLTFFVLYHFSTVREMASALVSILMPFIVGFIIAYLLAPIYNIIVRNLEDWLLQHKAGPELARKTAVAVGVFLSILVALLLLGGLAALVLPSFVNSVMGILNSMQSYIDKITLWINQFFANNPALAATMEEYLHTGSDQFSAWLTEKLLPSLQTISGSVGSGMGSVVSGLFSGIVAVFNAAKNLIIGFVVAAYLLVGKTNMIAHCKQLIYGLTSVRVGNRIVGQCRYIHQVFGGFIWGKIVDSLIIGVLCFMGTWLLRMPYAMLISVIVGVTNVIPFFGPFIGAIPCALLVLLNDPIKCITFVIFILALQQFDGNILGPKILGNTTGLSSFWVLFSIILFGGVFGFVGMIIGVPVFAVICSLGDSFLAKRMTKKALSTEIADYINLEQVEEQNGVRIYAKMQDPTKKN